MAEPFAPELGSQLAIVWRINWRAGRRPTTTRPLEPSTMDTDFVAGAPEKQMRFRILQGLVQRSGDGETVPSGAFQDVLHELGLRLGDAVVDRVLAVLELDSSTGMVSPTTPAAAPRCDWAVAAACLAPTISGS